jgi:hypothetical protein
MRRVRFRMIVLGFVLALALAGKATMGNIL